MRFLNRREDVQVRIEVNGEYQWILLKKDQSIDIPEQQGINYNLEKVNESNLKLPEVTQGNIGETIVETKKIISFEEKLDKIKGIGTKTIKDIISEFPTEEDLINAIKEGKKLPFRDDVELKLRNIYDKE